MTPILIPFSHPALQKPCVSIRLIGAVTDLARLLPQEAAEVGRDKDLGWDAASLIEEFGQQRKEEPS